MGDKGEETCKMIRRLPKDSYYAPRWFVYMWRWSVRKSNVMGGRLPMEKYNRK